jgi:hypothetical protein
MSEAAAKYMKNRKGSSKPEQHEHHRSREEDGALARMRQLAKKYGVKLENDGEGGLPSSLVLAVLKRDHFECKRCQGKRGKPITVHHKGGIPESKWLSEKGHSNDPNNIVTLCTECHDDVHEQARAEGVDSSQVKPKGDDFKGQHGHD